MSRRKAKRAKSKATDKAVTKKLKEMQSEWEATTGVVKEIIIEKYSDIEPEIIEWLWKDKIPREGITMFVGDPETYKSTTSLYVAAQVSKGRCFPNCDVPTEMGSVLILGSEDSHSAVVKPRLMAADANLSKIGHIKATRETDVFNSKKAKESYIVDLIAEINLVEKKVKAIPDFKLLIIDTLSSYLGARKINSMEDTRDFLDRLSELSYKYHFAVLIIHHFNKNEEASAQYRGSGSTGIRAGVRAQWAFVLDRHDKERAFMLRDKLNLTPVKTGLAFHMGEKEMNIKGKRACVGYCAFEDEVIHDDLQGFLNRRQTKQSPKRDEAVKWLKGYLGDGKKYKANDVVVVAEQHGITEKTLRRAAKEIEVDVKQVRVGGKVGHWTWQLKPDGHHN